MLSRRSESLPRVSCTKPAGRSCEVRGDDYGFLRSHRRPAASNGTSVRIVDLFAGCGGLSLGGVEAVTARGGRAEVALSAEVDPLVRDVYESNFPGAQVDPVGDVAALFDGQLRSVTTRAERQTRRRAGRVDLLIGGPPCQGHSNLNNHTRGNDVRNDLYLRMVRAAEILAPASLLIENVPSIRGDSRRVLESAMEGLMRLGYRVDAGVVDLSQLGVAQVRHRHVLLASSVAAPSLRTLVETHRRPVRPLDWAIGDLSTLVPTRAFDVASNSSPANASRAEWLIKNDRYDLPNRLRPACHRDKPDHRYKSMYGRLRWDQPAQTITTGFGSPGQGRYIHPGSPRTLTPHEAARIQFFPDWFDFTPATYKNALSKCIGNAVPPKLGFAAARYLLAIASHEHLAVQPASPVASASAAE